MSESKNTPSKAMRGLTILTLVNAGIWAISIIALVFVIQHSPGAKKMFPILAGGVAVSIQLIAVSKRLD